MAICPTIFLHLCFFICLSSQLYFMTFMSWYKKEVADRMVSNHNNKTYGRLSVAIQSRCIALKMLDIKPGAFHPRPKVLSSIVKLEPKQPLEEKVRSNLDEIIKMAFNQRRKKIRNSLKSCLFPRKL